MAKSVFIEGGDNKISRMFMDEGWIVVGDPADSDLICFSGGSDVSPMLYQAVKEAETKNSLARDEACCNIYYEWYRLKPMVGICRGGQFLNVMCGGSMDQHVENHGSPHDAMIIETGETIEVTSTHHQMMVPLMAYAEIIMTANEYEEDDPEVVYYEDENCLCFQPHPEFTDADHPCWKFFFECVETYLYN